MLDFYLNIYHHSGFYALTSGLAAFIMRLWHGSFFRRLFFEHWGLGFERELKLTFLKSRADESLLIGAADRVCEGVRAVAGGIYNGSVILRAAGGFFGITDLENYRGVWPVLITIMLIPILPTKYILALCCLNVALFGFLLLIGRARVRFSTADFFVLLFAALIAISIPISYIPSNSAVMGFVYILFILFYFVVKNTVDNREKLFAVMSALLVAGLLASALGILQRLTGLSFVQTEAWIDTDMFASNTTRVYSTLGNPNVLGEYLIFVSMFAFAGIYYFRNWFYKLAVFGIFGAAMLCMVFTLSRGAWLGIMFAFVLYTLIKDRRLIWLGVAGLLVLPFVIPEAIVERLLSIGNLEDTSSAYRFYIWQASLNMIKDYWPIGIGLGTRAFVYIYQKYAFTAVYAPHSHNLFLQLIIDLGVSGIFLFLGVIFMFGRNYLSRLKYTKDSFLTSAGAAMCAAMGGYLLQGLTDNVWYNYRIVAYFWVIIALGAALSKLMVKENENEKV